MRRTQRRRWIRQQAALYKEYEEKDHYSSRSTTDSDSMEVITGVEAPEYLKEPYIRGRKEDIAITLAKDEKDVAIPIVRNDISHKMQTTITKPHRGKEPKKIQNDHKRLEKESENIESEAESKKVNTSSSHVPILPLNYQTVQVWFGKKKQSLRGKKEAQDNSIEEEQIQETPTENLQDDLIEDIEDIEDIENIEGVEDFEGIEDIDNIEGIEVKGIEDIEGIEESEAMEFT